MMPEAPDTEPAICVRHISKSFGKAVVLRDLSVEVAHGEAFCLLGRSGIGKSVTLKLLIGLLKPDRGEVLIDGQDVQKLDRMKLAEVRKNVGFLFQGAALFDSISVSENVAFPLRRHTKKSDKEIQAIVREKLKQVELEGQEKKMPSELSGGMKKRVGLARAMALEPGILLIDEPSSGLDRITAYEISQLLLELKKKQKVTLVVVTHDVADARIFADRFAVLDRGKIVGSGTADQLERSDNSLVRQLMSGSEV